MEQLSTFFSILQHAFDAGYSQQFHQKSDEESLLTSGSLIRGQFKDLVIVQTILCSSDKSTVVLLKTLDGQKYFFVDYWESRSNF